MDGNSYDRGALEKILRGMSDRELRKFWWDLVNYHTTPYPDYLRVVLKATQAELKQRLRANYCLVGKMRKAMKPRIRATA